MLYELMKECLEIPYTHVGNSADFAVRRSGHRLYIFFQDSDGGEDWKNNLDFPARAYGNIDGGSYFAHRGFVRVWEDTREHLNKYISDKTVKKIIVVGYSHGAAIALLCHECIWSLRTDLRDVQEGFGFGCPRVIWGKIGKSADERWRHFTVIRNIDDIVTHVPPALLGYTHVGRLLEIGQKGRYTAIQAHLPQNILYELKLYEANQKALTRI